MCGVPVTRSPFIWTMNGFPEAGHAVDDRIQPLGQVGQEGHRWVSRSLGQSGANATEKGQGFCGEMKAKAKVSIKTSKDSYCLLIGQNCVTWSLSKGLKGQF